MDAQPLTHLQSESETPYTPLDSGASRPPTHTQRLGLGLFGDFLVGAVVVGIGYWSENRIDCGNVSVSKIEWDETKILEMDE
ncbi:uncharacterized protein N7469_001123 [Penicillium citrinum]|uniref:Uncharacterized protein n=1 Tax=Penicillium citrinum TaxID=5077 RepID=A0A9W9PE71_PENCI|nr:uncharacterized protein N7469_001123 [Penicillium citrinum]KAJ5242796.1 hypothetical protein N7469_001123 [Penicillium citrinum]